MKVSALTPAILALAASASAQQPTPAEPTPAEFRLVATRDFDGNDGSSGRPFRGAAIELFLEIEDATPSSYIWGAYQAEPVGGDGAFCPGTFQFFATENRRFALKHPRVRQGQKTIRVTGNVQEVGFDLRRVSFDFAVAAHPKGCAALEVPELPVGLHAKGPEVAMTGQPALISARARSKYTTLTFQFFAATAAGSQGGLPLGLAETVGDCRSNKGCSAEFDRWVPEAPIEYFLTVEAEGIFEKFSETVTVLAAGEDLRPARLPQPVGSDACEVGRAFIDLIKDIAAGTPPERR